MARVTLKTIANEAGVSIAAVSMALRGQGKLAKENVEHIQAIAKKLGYTPNPILASLASRRFRSGEAAEGLPMALLEFPPHEGETRGTVNQYREELKRYAEAIGYAPQVYPPEEIRRYQDFTRLLYHRGTVAVVIAGQPQVELFEQRERWQPFALAQCGRYRNILPLHTVRPNIFQAIQLAFERAYARGYRRIGFALGHHPEVLEDDLARFGSALAFLHHRLPEEQRIAPYFGSIEDAEAIVKWVRHHRPDVVISFTSAHWYFLHDAGIDIPGEVGFASLHLYPNQTHPMTIAGLDQARGEIARQTVLLLDQMVRHNERGLPEAARNILIQSSWIDGESLPDKVCDSNSTPTRPDTSL
jgi:LacI family transcriptional regulator